MGNFAKIASQIHQNTAINKIKHQKMIKFCSFYAKNFDMSSSYPI